MALHFRCYATSLFPGQNDRQSRRRRSALILHRHAKCLRLDSLRQRRHDHTGIAALIRTERSCRNRAAPRRAGISQSSYVLPAAAAPDCSPERSARLCSQHRSLCPAEPERSAPFGQRHPHRRAIRHRIHHLPRRRSIRRQLVELCSPASSSRRA